jgi:hypothetical protein
MFAGLAVIDAGRCRPPRNWAAPDALASDMKRLKQTKTATPIAAPNATGGRDVGKAATKPRAAPVLPENLLKAERIDRENDLA